MENTSGQSSPAAIPAEIDRWNWGAFLLNWIWGIGNNTFIALLMFAPLANMVMPFVLGAKGSAWAWQNKKWESVEQFRAVQRQWAKWGVIVWLVFIAFFVALFFIIAASLKSSDAYKLAVSTLAANEEVTRVIGQPLSAGIPGGSIQVSGPDGTASLSFSVSGPSGKGTVYMEAAKKLGQWHIDQMVLEQDSGKRIDLVP